MVLGPPSPDTVQAFLDLEDGDSNTKEKLDQIIGLIAECLDEDMEEPESRDRVYRLFFSSGGPDGELAEACLAKCGIDVSKVDKDGVQDGKGG